MANPKTFTFEVDPTSDVPLWVQLRQRLIYLITSGFFKPGDQLPTVRGLASDISINYNTVNKAYMSLVTEGYLESVRGRGVFVAGADAEEKDSATRELGQVLDDFISACRALGLSLPDIQFMVSRRILQLKRGERGGAPLGTNEDADSEFTDQRGKVLPLEERFADEGTGKRGRA
ncbi:MAG: GntR family transcriptional regulator [Eggerthellaceae bacterium]|nr:GntR family transcriptional regulator [Eggerthellaceae bacterium]MBR3258519.1 GntR family transcriptional regulator [Eggerthellaceae bacterium]